MQNLQPHQQRVIDEKRELDERLFKLRAFKETDTFETLPGDERVRLLQQATVMHSYSRILDERIAAFTP